VNKDLESFFKKNSKIKSIFLEVYSNILNSLPDSASNFFRENWATWQNYADGKNFNNSLPGAVFEKLFEIYCYLLSYQIAAQDEYFGEVPLVKPDFVLKNKNGEYLFLSLKTSLRERWKQADWEAIYFKEYYPDTPCILLTFDESEERRLQTKITDNLLKGLDDSCIASSKKLDQILTNFFN
jgi:hypothetical protein